MITKVAFNYRCDATKCRLTMSGLNDGWQRGDLTLLANLMAFLPGAYASDVVWMYVPRSGFQPYCLRLMVGAVYFCR